MLAALVVGTVVGGAVVGTVVDVVVGAEGAEEACGVVVLPHAPSAKAPPAASPTIAIILFLTGGLDIPDALRVARLGKARLRPVC